MVIDGTEAGQLETVGFTIITKRGIRYSANFISHTLEQSRSVISFVCSGTLFTFPADEVEAIGLTRHQQHCDFCDQRLPSVLLPQPELAAPRIGGEQ